MQKKNKSALIVHNGIEQPSQINEKAASRFVKRKSLTEKQYIDGILSGNRVTLGKAITLIESSLKEDRKLAQRIIEHCLPYSGKSLRIAITGVPGVGKSTFIEALGIHLTGKGHKLAVLAIDPSSARTKGSILGDKTRMEELSSSANAFIRPSPSGGIQGGVSRKTWETIILCEAAGFDTIFVETVGVGQSETEAYSMTDIFLLLMLPGAGDELQGIKRGIMEMADLVIINKADGDNLTKVNIACREYSNALMLFPPMASGWIPKVMSCSSTIKTGIEEIWDNVLHFKETVTKTGWFKEKRLEQSKNRMYKSIEEKLNDDFFTNNQVIKFLKEYEIEVITNKLSGYVAANKLLDFYYNNIKKQK